MPRIPDLAELIIVSAERVVATPIATIVGPVVHGDARGRALGFPTANVELKAPDAVAYGVYAARVDGRPAAVSVGVRPTFGQGL